MSKQSKEMNESKESFEFESAAAACIAARLSDKVVRPVKESGGGSLLVRRLRCPGIVQEQKEIVYTVPGVE